MQNKETGVEYEDVVIHLITGKTVKFRGRYAREKETNNWHYYQKESGKYVHFRKEHIVMIDAPEISESSVCFVK